MHSEVFYGVAIRNGFGVEGDRRTSNFFVCKRYVSRFSFVDMDPPFV